MIPDIGHHLLLAAAAAALLGAVPLARPYLVLSDPWQRALRHITCINAVLIAGAFAALMACFVMGDYSVAVVRDNSHSLKPLLYKISGTWGNHEGSLLLWLLVLAVCGVAALRARLDVPARTRLMAVMHGITFIFLILSIFTSNPFARIFPAPEDGTDLNPLLQDPGLAFHPPLLYLGYVGYALVFAIAIAALWEGTFSTAWARLMRLAALVAWSFLTAGLALGAWWAYYELGWGGWWFWDPVENMALIPWLVGAALLHSVRVTQTNGAMPRWTILMAIITFALSILGTFLVRSGVLTSVHAFASDPLRGMALLAVFALLIGGAFTLLAMRWPVLGARTPIAPISREGMLLLNNIFLAAGAATVLTGTLYPLVIDALGRAAITVGPPYYTATFVPLMLPLLAIVALGQALPWGMGANIRRHGLVTAGVMAVVGMAYIYAIGYRDIPALLAFMLGAGVVAATAIDKTKRLGQLLAHVGLGIAVMGMAGTALGTEAMTTVKLESQFTFAGYDMQVTNVSVVPGPNYLASRALIDVRRNGTFVTTLKPERRYYPVADQWTTEAAIYTTLLGDLFVATGAPDAETMILRLRWNPLQLWIWAGALLMLAGGIAATRRRRL